jgi:hypothetical protein
MLTWAKFFDFKPNSIMEFNIDDGVDDGDVK